MLSCEVLLSSFVAFIQLGRVVCPVRVREVCLVGTCGLSSWCEWFVQFVYIVCPIRSYNLSSSCISFVQLVNEVCQIRPRSFQSVRAILLYRRLQSQCRH